MRTLHSSPQMKCTVADQIKFPQHTVFLMELPKKLSHFYGSVYLLVAIVSTGFFVTVALAWVFFLLFCFSGFFQGACPILVQCSKSLLTHLAGHARFYGSTAGLLG